MLGIYTSIICISCFALVVLFVLVYENARFDSETKGKLYAIYALIFLCAIAEYLAFYLNGKPSSTIGIHKVAKCADFILSPLVAVFFVRLIYSKAQWLTALFGLVSINTVIEIASIFTGWTFYVDSDNYYHHGPAYNVYMTIYAICIVVVIAGFYAYGTKFKKKNWLSIGLIGALVGTGVILQEVFNSNWRTCILALTLSAILQFIHYSEFWQQQSDERILNHKMLLEKDALTGMMTRYAYNQMLEYYEGSHSLQKNHVVVSIDVNGLKNTNDTYGHAAGDELIKGAAECVLKAFSPFGKVFRTGGDEFVAIVIADNKALNEIKITLDALTDGWKGTLIQSLSLSCGYVRKTEYPDASLNELLLIADKRMYTAKSNYYRTKGVDRRSQRAAYDAICNSYTKILKLNLLTDTYEIIGTSPDEMTTERGFAHSISDWLNAFGNSDQVHPDDRELFLKETDITQLKEFFNNGNKYKNLHYRRTIDGEFKTVLMELVRTDDYSPDNQTVFLYVKDIGILAK